MLTAKPRFPVKQILLCGLWPSPLKKLIYRIKGYRIGKGVHLGFGSVICGRDVEIGNHTRLGFFSIIRGTSIRLGAHISIGSTSILDTPYLEIGDGTKINEQVFVGGLQFPDSRLVIGRNCQIMQSTFINPARWITIGDDTGIGGDCLIFGHTSWLSKFEGYPVDFQPVEIGNSVSLAWRVFVVAGAKIGDGAVIGANSLVNRTIPPRCVAVGSPARVIAKAPIFPRNVTESEKEVYLERIVGEIQTYLDKAGLKCRLDGSLLEVEHTTRGWLRSRAQSSRLWVEYKPVNGLSLEALPQNLDVLLSLRRLPKELRRELAKISVMWIDIESKERPESGNDLGEEVIQYLRRYGVRFFRVDS